MNKQIKLAMLATIMAVAFTPSLAQLSSREEARMESYTFQLYRIVCEVSPSECSMPYIRGILDKCMAHYNTAEIPVSRRVKFCAEHLRDTIDDMYGLE